MFKKKSMETVLKEIYEAYPDAFADGRRLSGLFADFSGGQLRAQKNQLDIFLKCGGNTRILALRDEAPRIQQREYHRLVGEMTDTYGMQQELALEISSTFWKTALGTQAPAMAGQKKNEKPAKKPLGTQAPTMAGQEKNEKPAKKPLGTQAPTMGGQEKKEKSVIKPSEKQPAKQKRQQNAVLASAGKHWQGMSIFARIMFVIGLYGAISYAIALVLVFAGVAETDGTLSVLLCLAHFLLYVWYLFCLFSNEGAGYPGVYGALVSKLTPQLKFGYALLNGLLTALLFVFTLVYWYFYMAGGLIYFTSEFIWHTTLVGIWAEFLYFGLVAYSFFTSVWAFWRLMECVNLLIEKWRTTTVDHQENNGKKQ